MKKNFLLIVLALAMTNVCGATTYYWVGGNGSWGTASTASFATSSGGTGIALTPAAADKLIFDTNSGGGGSFTVTLTAATTITDLEFKTGGTVSFAGSFTFTINSSLAFSGSTKIQLTSQNSFTLGNGTNVFSLTGNDTNNYFINSANNFGYLSVNNNVNGSLDLYVNSINNWFALQITKGTTNLISNCFTQRLLLNTLNNQRLKIGENKTLTIGGGTFGNTATACGTIDASAPGCTVAFFSNPDFTGKSVFLASTKITNLQYNQSGGILKLGQALAVDNLLLTAGTINNSTNNITINNGGTITRSHQAALLTSPPVYGTTASDRVNVTYTANVTTANELLGTVGSIGTMTINNAVTATLSNSGISNIALGGTLTGYSSPTVSISAPNTGGTTATASLTVTGSSPNKIITGICITNPGFGYATAPTVTINDATGINWTATATLLSGNPKKCDNIVVGGGTSGTLTYPNSSPVTLTANNITVNAGGFLTCGTQTNSVTHLLNIGGNINGIGTITPVTTANTKVVDVTMDGTDAQSINNAITFNGLTISNTTAPVTAGAALNATNLTIGTGSIFNIAAGKELTVSTSMSNTGTINLLSTSADGTATILTPGSISGTGTTNVQQYLAWSRNWYMNSPVSGALSLPTVDAGSLTFYLYMENDANQATGANGYEAGAVWNTESSGTMALGTGYIVKPSAATSTVTFTGTGLNTGDKTISGLTYTAANPRHGFNLIGNPYPSYVKWSEVVKTNINQTMWYRTNVGGTYKFYTYLDGTGALEEDNITVPSGVSNFIPPMQAFWVKVAASQTGSVQFLNTSRAHKDITGNLLKAPKLSSIKLLRLQVSNGLNDDETVVYFNSNVTNDFDDYDSPKMFNNRASFPEIYTTLGAEKLIINGLNEVKYDTEIPLGFVTGQSNTFCIKATEFKNFEASTRIILRDKENLVDYELNGDNAYSFTSDVVNTTSRFSLIFKSPASSTDITDTKNSSIYAFVNANNNIVIVSPEKASYSIYNAVGQKITDGLITSNSTTLNSKLQNGVYVVRVANNNLTRVIIK